MPPASLETLADADDFAAFDSSVVDPFAASFVSIFVSIFVGTFDDSFAWVETSEAVVADGDDWIDCND